jgi:archaemetzincin
MSIIRLVIIALTTTLFSYCSSPGKPAKKHPIGLQPLGQYDQDQLQFIQKELQQFYNAPIVILNKREIPASFLNTSKGERYSSDSIIKWLAHTAPDSVYKVVGITHKDIFTTKWENGHIKKPENAYAVWGIFGLGYLPGRSCVVSDHRLQTTDNTRFHHRLRTVVIHELGHNLGLPHCPSDSCIMNDANESIQTVDKSADDYCKKCRAWLTHGSSMVSLLFN